jgi:hypothetical protein
MKNAYPLKKKYSFKRALMDTLQYGEPQLASERDKHEEIRGQFRAHKLETPSEGPHPISVTRPTMRGEHSQVLYVPYSKFGSFSRADVSGGTFQQIASIGPKYTTGLIGHNKVYRLGATLLEGCDGQVILPGTAQLPAPAFASTTGGTAQTLTNCTIAVGSTAVTVSSSATLAVGMMVSGTGIQSNTVISTVVDSTHVTLNAPALASSSTASLTFYAIVDGTQQSPNSPPVFLAGSVSGNPIQFQPLRLSVKIPVSKQLLAQSPDVFVPVLRDVISRSISGKLDDLALFGSGPANGQPLGIFNAVSPVNLGATGMTFAQYQLYRNAVLRTDLDPDSFGGLMSPDMLSYLDGTQFASNASYSILEKMRDVDYTHRFLTGNEVNVGTGMATTTTQTGTLNSTTAVTGLTGTASLVLGMPVSGTNIPAGTTIAAITSATAITLSQAATGSGSVTLTFTAARGLFLGLWRFCYILLWTQGLEVVFDPYSSADTNETIVRANLLANVGIPFPAAFQAIYQQ